MPGRAGPPPSHIASSRYVQHPRCRTVRHTAAPDQERNRRAHLRERRELQQRQRGGAGAPGAGGVVRLPQACCVRCACCRRLVRQQVVRDGAAQLGAAKLRGSGAGARWSSGAVRCIKRHAGCADVLESWCSSTHGGCYAQPIGGSSQTRPPVVRQPSCPHSPPRRSTCRARCWSSRGGRTPRGRWPPACRTRCCS